MQCTCRCWPPVDIADGRGLIAALALGASGMWMGTRFVASEEALAHDNYKSKIVEINEEGTVVTRCHSGKPCRLIRNRFTDSVGRARARNPPVSIADPDQGGARGGDEGALRGQGRRRRHGRRTDLRHDLRALSRLVRSCATSWKRRELCYRTDSIHGSWKQAKKMRREHYGEQGYRGARPGDA